MSTGSSSIAWLLSAGVLANETRTSNELPLNIIGLDMRPKRGFRRGIAFALLRLNKNDGV